MKKTIAAILIMTIAALSCFATDKPINLSANVSYENSIVMALVASKTQVGTYTASDVTGLNLKAAGTVYFKVLDSSSYNNTETEVYTVSIAVTPFENSNGDQMAVALNALTTVTAANLSYSTVVDNSFDVTYAAYKSIINSNVEIANFNASWLGNANIPAGDYTSTVTLTYAAK
ncbi:MAG: hypothetical protein WCR70_07770 [Sphaerochaetaceae bacterium]